MCTGTHKTAVRNNIVGIYVCMCVCVCRGRTIEGGPHGSRAPIGRLRRQLEKDKKLQS